MKHNQKNLFKTHHQDTITKIKNFDPTFKLNVKNNIKTFQNTFLKACANGRLDIARCLLSFTHEFTEKIIYANNFQAFRRAAVYGHYAVINFLLEVAKDDLKRYNMLHSMSNAPFIGAAKAGHLEVLKLLIDNTISPPSKNAMIHAQNNKAFIVASQNGQLGVIKFLLHLTPDPQKQHNMLHAQNNKAFIVASQNGQLGVMQFLLHITPDPQKQHNMLHAQNNKAFMLAARHNHLECMKLILANTYDSQRKKQMLLNNNYYAYKCAVANKNKDMLKFLLLQLTRNDIEITVQNLHTKYFDDYNKIMLLDEIAPYALKVKKYGPTISSFLKVSHDPFASFREASTESKRPEIPDEIILNIFRQITKDENNITDLELIKLINAINQKKQNALSINRGANYNKHPETNSILQNDALLNKLYKNKSKANETYNLEVLPLLNDQHDLVDANTHNEPKNKFTSLLKKERSADTINIDTSNWRQL